MPSTISVPYEIAQGDAAEDAINETWTQNEGPTARVRFRCAWTDRYQFVRDLLGAGGFQAPFAYPLSPGLYCTGIESIRPLGGMTDRVLYGGASWPVYNRAEVVASFGIPKYNIGNGTTGDISGQPWITTTFDLSVDNFTIPDTSFYWEGTSDPLNDSQVNYMVTLVGIRFQRQWAPLTSVVRALDYVGSVNDATFQLGEIECEAETLLFMGGPSERSLDTQLQWKHELTYNFAYRRAGWNKAYNAKATGDKWQYINAVSGGTDPTDRLYPLDDFTALFSF